MMPGRPVTGWMPAWLLICAGLASAQDAAEQPVEPAAAPATPIPLPISIESRPYRIRLRVADADSDGVALSQELSHALDRSVGALWDAQIAPLENMSRIDGAALRRWTAADAAQRFAAEDVDVWFAVTVSRQGSERQVAVRAWQPRFEWLSPVNEAAFYEPRETASRVVQMCWNLFRPQIVIEHVEQNQARFRIPAGDLKPADPAFALLRPGDCLTPWLFYYDRDRKLKRRQELPWTYVRLDQIDGPLATGTVLSGLRSSLSGKTRGRIDKVAVLAKPVYSHTRLQLSVQNQPARLLAGYRLELRPKLPPKKTLPEAAAGAEGAAAAPAAVSNDDVVKVLTDRIGEAQLNRMFEHPLTWIFVYSGDLMLARVPFVVGSLPSLRLEVPDDSVRLRVEGELQALESELINLVAERNTLIATIRGAVKQAKWDRVAELRKELDKLPTHGDFDKKLTAIRVLAVQEARARKDRSGELRLVKLCGKVSELINRYLDPDKLRLVKDEFDDLQKAVQDVKP